MIPLSFFPSLLSKKECEVKINKPRAAWPQGQAALQSPFREPGGHELPGAARARCGARSPPGGAGPRHGHGREGGAVRARFCEFGPFEHKCQIGPTFAHLSSTPLAFSCLIPCEFNKFLILKRILPLKEGSTVFSSVSCESSVHLIVPPSVTLRVRHLASLVSGGRAG